MWIKLNITKAKKKKKEEIYRSQEKPTNKNTKKLHGSGNLSSVEGKTTG